MLLVSVTMVATVVATPETADARSRKSQKLAKMGTHGPIPSVPRAFVGVVADDALWGTDADPSGAGTIAGVRRMGAGTIRVPFLWSRFEPRPGEFDPQLYDHFVAQAAKGGVSVLPVLFDPPPHRSSRPASGAAGGTYPPASNHDFGRFAASLVSRYGPGGTFWHERPWLPRRPITAWQVWNEPNIRSYWPSGPDPAAYTAMLRAVAPMIRAADPRAEVVTAGLTDSERGVATSRFLAGMYRAGARGSFSSLGIHPYAPTPTGVIAQLQRVRRVMRRHGDRAGVRITEVGWATGGPDPRRRVSEHGQARHTRQTMARLFRLRRTFRLRGVCLYNWRDAPPASGGGNHWGLYTGLHAYDGRPKPVLGAVSGLLRRVVAG